MRPVKTLIRVGECVGGSEPSLCAPHARTLHPWLSHITKTYLYKTDPLKPHFYTVRKVGEKSKLDFTGIYIIFLFLLKIIEYGYSLEPPRRGGFNEYIKSMF